MDRGIPTKDVLAEIGPRTHKERAVRRRKLLWQRFREL